MNFILDYCLHDKKNQPTNNIQSKEAEAVALKQLFRGDFCFRLLKHGCVLAT